MWSAPVTSVEPADEPVNVAEAKEYLSIDADETQFDTMLGGFIMAARQHVEAVTGTRLVEQVVVLRASAFADLASLPIGPVSAVAAIAYEDTAGVEQALDGATFEIFGAGLQQGIRPAYGSAWPVARNVEGSIRITATVGYAEVPRPVWLAILRMVADMFANRETVVTGTVAQPIPDSVQVMALLANHRIWL